MHDKNKSKIVLILPRGEAIRNFVLSGTAASLRESAYLIILSVIPNEDIEKILRSNCDEFYELQNRPVPKFMEYFWDWMDIVHGRWLWSGAARHRWQVRDFEALSYSKKIKRFFQKIFAYPFATRPGLEFLSWFEGISYNVLTRDPYFVDLFKKVTPDLVFNGSHVHSIIARPAVHAAKKLHIKTATFLFSWDNLTSQGRIIPYYDYYIVWNEYIKNDLLKIYKNIDARNVFISGTPQFDFHFRKEYYWSREKYCAIMGLDPLRPIILYTTSMSNLVPSEEIIVERLADMCLKSDLKPQILVRLYPKDTSGRFDYIVKKRSDVVLPTIRWEPKFLTPMPEDLEVYSNMLLNCDLGINVASTVSLELCMFDKPVINVAYNPHGVDIYPKNFTEFYQWDHYKPITDSGAIDVVYSEDQMPAAIESAIKHPEIRREERKKLMQDFFGPYLDGMAYHRIAEQLSRWAEEPVK